MLGENQVLRRKEKPKTFTAAYHRILFSPRDSVGGKESHRILDHISVGSRLIILSLLNPSFCQ